MSRFDAIISLSHMAEFIKRKEQIDAELMALERKRRELVEARAVIGAKVWVVNLTITNFMGTRMMSRGGFTTRDAALAAIPKYSSSSKYTYTIDEVKLDPTESIAYYSD
jgi:hypothetical protein